MVLADYVTTEDGTGLVHQSPAFGEDDMATARRHDLEAPNPVGPLADRVILIEDGRVAPFLREDTTYAAMGRFDDSAKAYAKAAEQRPADAQILADYGADVIKIDSPHRKTVLRHNDINRAKRSVLIDLKTKAGLEIFWKLVDQADVVLQNFRSGVAEQHLLLPASEALLDEDRFEVPVGLGPEHEVRMGRPHRLDERPQTLNQIPRWR